MRYFLSFKKIAAVFGMFLAVSSIQLHTKKFTDKNAIARMHTINSLLSGRAQEVFDVFNIWAKANEVKNSIEAYSQAKKELLLEQGQEGLVDEVSTMHGMQSEQQPSKGGSVQSKEASLMEETEKQNLIELEFLRINKDCLLEPIKLSLAVFHGLHLWINAIAIDSFGGSDNFKKTIIHEFFSTPHAEASDFFNKRITDLDALRKLSNELATLSEDILVNLSKPTIMHFVKECGNKCDKAALKTIVLEHKKVHTDTASTNVSAAA